MISERPFSSSETCSIDGTCVDWDGPDDPAKPVNWPLRKKAKNLAIICYLSFLTPFSSTMFAPAVSDVMDTFHSTSAELASFVVSAFVLGYCFGPLFLGPASELYGRAPIYHMCNISFAVFCVGCAVSNSLGLLIAFRFLAGMFGGCPITIGAGSLADMFKQENRGAMIATWAVGPLVGPIIGPITGGFLSQHADWRWVFWLIVIAAGFGALVSLLLLDETYPPTILGNKVARLRKSARTQSFHSVYDTDPNQRTSKVFVYGIVRAVRLFLFSPIVSILSIYQAISYGYLYLLFTTFPPIFQTRYHFSKGGVGLAFLGIGTGSIIAQVFGGLISDAILKRLAGRGVLKPEYRLPPLFPTCFAIPIALFWYGWAAEKKAHWIVPLVGTGLLGFALNIVFTCVVTYLIDAHPLHETSAVAASVAVRSLGGALLPLAGRAMYTTMGLGWGNSLLGFLTLAMCPFPWMFYKYGERIRTNPKFQIKW
ncbi:MFS general substrate transporter [Mytilinidion resinicola]|uniref:MFS general substrate transporter n=1 Tax=Mytilinidion resinicola TaxID=574789 RepID=A0A6A6YD02_9PEZI|nr:MFS general substrate transporter [Mytilinidion resinicola]KAF2806393.1 MFS general substrate transporter [Mytilinidion resinicola]